jgi:hypothetical protein
VNLVPNIYENYCAYPLYFHAPCSVFFLFWCARATIDDNLELK